MANFSDDRHAAIAAAYDFSGAKLIGDIGGGNGETLRHILSRYSVCRGLVFDRKDVVEAIPPSGLLDGRLETDSGSFFEPVPGGADVYLLVRVLHDWSDDDCIRILQSVRAAMAPHARLLIAEQLIDPDPACGVPTTYLVDMQMMAMFGTARERTQSEFERLLAQSGFSFCRIIPTETVVWLVEAMPEAQPLLRPAAETEPLDAGVSRRTSLP